VFFIPVISDFLLVAIPARFQFVSKSCKGAIIAFTLSISVFTLSLKETELLREFCA
jgi:hypothetical protein